MEPERPGAVATRMTPSRQPRASGQPGLPAFGRAALLLDLDGTLLDIAPRPDLVVVPTTLRGDLCRLRARLQDALAIVSGRPVEQVDALLGGAAFAVAGEHGGALRHAPGAAIERPPLPDPPPAWLHQAEQIAALHPGVLLERKRRGFVLHFRAVPGTGEELHRALRALIAPHGNVFELMPASMAWEVRPRGVDKGSAVAALMRLPPFAGRVPVFLGDDVTDEDAIRAVEAMGGAGLRVPERFGSAAGVRAWLARAAEEGAWPGW